MAKGRGSKSTKLQAKRDGTAPKAVAATEEATEVKTTRHVSEALRQAVKDLGGDDDDLDLIAGIDDSENEDEFESTKKDNVDEVCYPRVMNVRADVQGLKKALGDFMKGLDFKSVAPDGAVSEEEEEDDEEDEEEGEGSEVSSFDSDEEEEEDDEDEDEEEDEEDEEEESEEEPEPVVAAAVKTKVEKPKEKSVAVKPEVDNLGAKVRSALSHLTPLTDRTYQPHPSGRHSYHHFLSLLHLSNPFLNSNCKVYVRKQMPFSKTFHPSPERAHLPTQLSSPKS